jgi:hypothetical protein
MSILKLPYFNSKYGKNNFDTLHLTDFNRFNQKVLGLGDITKEGKYQEALAAVFDLQGFTSFCNQIEPHLVIPEFLNLFLSWLFHEVSSEFTKATKKGRVFVWCRLPFFAKYLGDGVLFLWDTNGFELTKYGNIVLSLNNICTSYSNDFLPTAKKTVSKAPSVLRCGIARGQIISIGNGNDFVGACINVASRIQKLPPFTFAFSQRGFNPKKCFSKKIANDYKLIRTTIRGLGDEELVYVDASQYALLTEEEKRKLAP